MADSDHVESEMDSENEGSADEEYNLSDWLGENHAKSASLWLEFTGEEDGSLTMEASLLVGCDFYVESDTQRLIGALQDNTETDIVEVCLDGLWAGTQTQPTGDELVALLTMLCQRPTLVGLILEGGRGSPTVLSLILNHAKNLKTLEIYDVTLVGTEASFSALAESFRNHPRLKHVNSLYLETDSTSVDHLVRGLLRAPALQSLKIWTKPRPGEERFATSTLIQACSSLTLTSLILVGVLTETNLQEDGVTQMAKALEQNSVLRHLQWGLDMNATTSAALARIIGRNKTLDSIRVDISQDPMTIRRNEKFILNLASALKNNQTLTKFRLCGELNAVQLHESVLEAYESALQTNFTLHNLVLLDYNLSQRETMDFYLKMNGNGRKGILGAACHNTPKWLEAIASAGSDSIVFYYLSLNPSIFSAFSY